MSVRPQPRIAVVLRPILKHVTAQVKGLPNRRDSHQCFDLEDLPDRVAAEMPAVHRLQHALLSIVRRLMDGAREAEPSDPQALMRDLTGAWLGLYFLGAPFPHPWEVVARHAERNGYYRDGGIFKAAGDIYRSARKAPPPDSRGGEGDQRLLLFDLNPLAFNRLVAQGTAEGAGLSDLVAALGSCYELLQLRLYIRAGRPIAHVLLEETLSKACSGVSSNASVESLCELAKRAYGGLPPRDGQSITIIQQSHRHHAKLSDMSGCVLAPSSGVYRSRLLGNGGANGNRLTTPQHVLYRSTLLEALAEKSGLKTVTDSSDLSTYLRGLQAPGPSLSPGTGTGHLDP